jgi:TonB family protein
LALPLAMLSLDAGYAPQEVPSGLHAPAVPKDLVGEAARTRIGRGKVERGMVHPYYVQLGKALVKNWDADRAVSQTGLKGWAESMGENSRTWNSIWKERAATFGKTGTPFEEPPPDMPMMPVNDHIVPYAGNATDQMAKRELQRQMNMAFKATRRATIRVVQDKDGRLTKVELVDPSNDEHVDKEAIADVRAAAQKLPPPPVEALNEHQELSSLWSFELVVSISPPVPTITFEFDEVLGFMDPRLPLDRRIYKKVKLVSVE